MLWIVEYIVTFIELFMCCVFCGKFLSKKEMQHINHKKFGLIGIVTAVFTIAGEQVWISQWYSIVFTIAAIIIISIFYHGTWIRIIGASFIYACIVIACDALILIFYTLFSSQVIQEIIETKGPYRVGASILSKFLLVTIILILSKKHIPCKSLENKYWIRLLLLANVLLIMAYFLVDLLISNTSFEKIVAVIIVYYVIMIIVISAMIFLFIRMGIHQEEKQKYHIIQMTNELLERELYNNENTLIQWKKAQHDYKNNLICMQELLKTGEVSDLENYINSLIQQSGEILYQYKTGNKIGDILFNQKLLIAKNLGIFTTVNVVFPKECMLSDTDFCAIFGNALDNAIEGCKDCEIKKIRIVIKQIKGFLIIKIENTVKEDPFKGNRNLYTTKKDKDYHGIGLMSIQHAMQKYGGFMELSYEEEFFIFQGIIPLKEVTN